MAPTPTSQGLEQSGISGHLPRLHIQLFIHVLIRQDILDIHDEGALY